MKCKMIGKVAIMLFTMVMVMIPMTSCKVKYSFTGASIPPEVKTVSIQYFPNNATMVAPILSSTLVQSLQDKFSRNTKLMLTREDGDFNFEGEITNYTSTSAAISGNEHAVLNRLTITVKVKFTNKFNEKMSYNKTFSQYAEYNSEKLLQEVEPTLIPEIVELLVEDIFNAAVSNW